MRLHLLQPTVCCTRTGFGLLPAAGHPLHEPPIQDLVVMWKKVDTYMKTHYLHDINALVRPTKHVRVH
jgi:hypothetical protein